jgi:predicted amidohydrolase YtcJ
MYAAAPHLILLNGKIVTMDAAQPTAAAIAIAGERIAAVGSDAEIAALAGPATRVIDLAGALVLPGFCDAHIHLSLWALARREVQIADAASRAEMLSRVAAAAAEAAPGQWLVGRGWNESRWGETDFPTAADLDAVTGPDRPAILYRSDLHSAVVNNAALRLAGVDAATVSPPGGVIDRDAAGRPTGFLRELAIDLVSRHIPLPEQAERLAALRGGMAELHRLGITAVHAQRIKEGTDGAREWADLLRLRENGDLCLRVNCNIAAHDLPHLVALGLRTGFGDNRLRLGHVKVFSDGSLGSRTAWMLESFEQLTPDEAENCGVSVTPPEQMAAEFRAATLAGFPISVHAIGDRANRVVLDIFEELADAGLQPPLPHRIEHVQILHPADWPRLAALDITASVQPIHALDDMDTADLFLGERTAHIYAFRSLLDSGALLAFGSDAPVADANPFVGIHAAVVRQRPANLPAPAWHGEQRLTMAEAVYAYTLGAARAAGWDRAIGSLTPGKLGDLIMLDRDIFALAAQDDPGAAIAETKVRMTVFGGEVVWEER